MNWSLIAAGVMAGLGLVIAKQWFDRRLEGREGKGGYRRRAGSVSPEGVHAHHEAPLQAQVTAADAQEEPPPPGKATPVAGTEPPLEETPVAEVSEGGHAEPGPVGGGDVETAVHQDTEVSPWPDTTVTPEPDREVTRTQVPSDRERVEEALASGDLALMERVLQEADDPILRHLLLNRLVAGHYRRRSEPGHREAFYRVAYAQIEEAAAILRAFEATGRPRPEHIEAFKAAAIALAEDERYDEAMAICEKALSLGLEDGTKTGFKGRIARLKKRRDANK